MIKSFLQILLIGLITFNLFSCSAGGGETGTGQTDSAISVGVITGFGSVFVNGVEFETSSSTQYSINDDSNALESQLAVGMLVSISGNVNQDGTTGFASAIAFEDNVKGIVLVNNYLLDQTLNVMGQNVVIDENTVFESKVPTVKIFEEILVNHIVDVSGYSAGDGTIYATRVELVKASIENGDKVKIKGIATNVNSNQFSIGQLQISYAVDTLENENSILLEGDFVEVKSDGVITNNRIVASEIRKKQPHTRVTITRHSEEVEFEGIITSVEIAESLFSVNGQDILYDDITTFENGTAASILKNKRVKIEAVADDNGNILAKKIKFKETSFTRLEGEIEAINQTEKSITVLGTEVFITNNTRLKDDIDGRRDDERQYFNFGELKTKQFVEINAFIDSSSNKLIASKLERKNARGNDEERSLKGIIGELRLNENIVIVAGIQVDISNVFFDGNIGDKAEIHGQFQGDKFIATEFESEALSTDEKAEDDDDDEGDDDDDDDDDILAMGTQVGI